MSIYPFRTQLAEDPSAVGNVARDAVVTFYDSADVAGSTPLVLTDPNGLPFANPVTTSAQGFVPAFRAPVKEVMWKGAGFTGFMTSFEGILEQAEAVAASASDAALASESSAQSSEASKQAAVDAAALVDAPADEVLANLAGNPDSQFAGQLSSTYASGFVHFIISDTEPTETTVDGKPVVWIDTSETTTPEEPPAETVTYSEVVLADDPALYFTMDDAAGTGTITSIGSSALTMSNTGATFGSTDLGGSGTSASFSGGSVGLTSSATSSFLSGATSVSIDCLVEYTSGAGTAFYHQSILELFPMNSGKTVARIGAVGAPPGAANTVLTAGVVYHIAVTWDGANARFYKNGVLTDTLAHTAAAFEATAKSFTVGAAYTGKISDLAVYKNKALTDARVLAHAQAAGKA